MDASAMRRFWLALAVFPVIASFLFLIGTVAADNAAPPGKPGGLAVTVNHDAMEVAATWDETAGAASYKIRWRRPSGNFQADAATSVSSNNANITLPDYGKWVVRVEACNDAGCGRGAARTAEIARPSSVKPENLKVVAQSKPMSFRATWDAAAGATTYKLRWRPAGQGFHPDNQLTTASAEADFTVSSAGEWIVRLDGCNDAGCSKAKNVRINVEPPLAEPSVCDRTPQVRDKLAQITGKACDSITADDLAGITALDLVNTDIVSLKNGDFNDLSGLKKLDLSFNDITALPEDVFQGLSNLERLDLFDNMIAALPEDVFQGLSSLEFLDLNCGRMSTLPEDVFDGLSNLETLILAEGYLTELPEDVFDGLSGLETLYIGDNRLTTLPEGIFDGLSNLRILELATNNLAALPEDVFDGLTSLYDLDLENNDLTALPEDVFDGLSSLYKLNLKDNEIEALPEDVFDGLSSVEHLDLKNNELTELSEEMFEGVPKMWSLGLSGNPGYPFDLDLGDFVWID